MTASRPSIPGGEVSSIVGRWQAPALRWLTGIVLVTAVLGVAAPGSVGTGLATAAVTVVVATPLLRVTWLVFRWRQEDDRRFVAMGLGLVLVIAAGAALAALGMGS